MNKTDKILENLTKKYPKTDKKWFKFDQNWPKFGKKCSFLNQMVNNPNNWPDWSKEQENSKLIGPKSQVLPRTHLMIIKTSGKTSEVFWRSFILNPKSPDIRSSRIKLEFQKIRNITNSYVKIATQTYLRNSNLFESLKSESQSRIVSGILISWESSSVIQRKRKNWGRISWSFRTCQTE